MAQDKRLQVFIERVRDGLLRVGTDGVAWSVAHRHKSSDSIIPHEPRRYSWKDRDGYIKIAALGLWDGVWKTSCVFLHRLVYTLHVGEIPEGFTINHKNGVKTDNRVENLEAVTTGDNTRHAAEVLGKRPWRTRGALNRDSARALFLACKAGHTNDEVRRMFNVSIRTVHDVKTYRTWGRHTYDL